MVVGAVQGRDEALASGSWNQMRDELRTLRETDERASDYTVVLGEKVIAGATFMGDEKWAIYEQLCVAHLDVGAVDHAQKYCDLLKARFPTSSRYLRLAGMLLEARGDSKAAIQLYSDAIKEHPTSGPLMKRRIAAFRGMGNLTMAQNLLKKYLQLYAVDHEAWLEMADLCLVSRDFNEAAFCYEELILSFPNNHIFHARLAEVMYTLGGIDNLVTARTHFAAAHKILPTNLRALLGLQRTCRRIVKEKCAADVTSVTKRLLEKASTGLGTLAAESHLLTLI